MTASGTALPALLWMAASGLLLTVLNGVLRIVAQEMDPYQAQFLRYLCGLLVMLPFVLRDGLAQYRPKGLGGQLWRGAVHTAGLALWFTAVPHVPLAEMAALGFTSPIWIMLGAVLFLREPAVPARWVAAGIGFLGVLVVVAPQFSGEVGPYTLVMLASGPLFAASFLITKALTRRDSASVIVLWQSITVSLFSLPLAIPGWAWPSATQWAWLLICGVLGSAGHFCLTRAFSRAEMSLLQPIRFLDLVWAALLGLLIWGDRPGPWTLLGAAVIFGATSWLARREARAR